MKVYSIVPLLAAPVLFFVCGCRMFDEKIQPPGFAQLGLTESAEDNCLFRHSSGGTLKLVPRKRHCFINGRMFYLPDRELWLFVSPEDRESAEEEYGDEIEETVYVASVLSDEALTDLLDSYTNGK
jgi:hypothetical protein